MKKGIVSLIASMAALSIAGSAFAVTFSDIKGDQFFWCAPQIEEMAGKGYITGYEDGTFRPDETVTKLEGIALFARMMGSGDKANEDLLKTAHTQYDSAIRTAGLSWGQDELVYMLYKGALTASDITTYIAGEAKNTALTRGEAAVIITKAMGGEEKATQNMSVSLEYLDAKLIPTNYLQYVKYVTDNGIMQGTDNNFNAANSVTRAQLAVMLSRVDGKSAYSFISGTLTNVDPESSTITITADGTTKSYSYTDDTKFKIKGDIAAVSAIPGTVAAVVQLSGDKVAEVDAMSEEADETISGVFASYNTNNGIIKIGIKESATDKAVKMYTCVENVPITYKSSPATIRSISNGDPVKLELSGGLVQSIVAGEALETITGATVEDIAIDGEKVSITISSADSKYNGQSYPVASTVKVKKSNNDAELSSIYKGDKVTLTLRYGEITDIVATSTYATANGVIESILIAAQPAMTVKVDGKAKTYQIPLDCAITVNSKEGSIYDFRVGDSVSITTQSNAITKIATTTGAVNIEGGVTGVVAAVNSNYGFISIMVGSNEYPVTVFKNAKTTFITSDGKSVDMKSIKPGDTVQCNGSTTNGAFVATLVMVTKAAD